MNNDVIQAICEDIIFRIEMTTFSIFRAAYETKIRVKLQYMYLFMHLFLLAICSVELTSICYFAVHIMKQVLKT